MGYVVADVVATMRQLAPEAWAEAWDNVGWLVRCGAAEGRPLRVVLSLDPVDPAWAVSNGFTLNVCHHPSPFRPLSSISDRDWAARAYAAGLNLYAAHTNLDAAPGGVNDALADALGLRDTRPLLPSAGAALVKFVTYVPPTHLDAVRSACAQAGAGHIGNYDECSFSWPGEGTFRPLPGADPYTGTAHGALEKAAEYRLEMIVPAHLQGAVVEAAKAAHPYEEMAYDVYSLANPDPRVGLGRIGTLEMPVEPDAFAAFVRSRLKAGRLALAGHVEAVSTVAVIGGSGGGHVREAREAGAQALVTGEAGHHDALEARDLGMLLVDAGHFATERVILEPLKSHLETALPGLEVAIADETDPLRAA